MNNDSEFDTYLFLGSKKIIISICSKKNFRIIHLKEIELVNNNNFSSFDDLDIFLKENIFKIEKTLKKFIKNIYLIIQNIEFFNVQISIKKNIYEDFITKDTLVHLLNDAKDQCKKTLNEKKIIHMLIDNYHLNNRDYSYLPEQIKSSNLCLDIRFICLPKSYIKSLEKVLKKYQISLSQIISADYVLNFFDKENSNLFFNSSRIIAGYNKNEVRLVSKTNKNKGFFEKFFDFFG